MEAVRRRFRGGSADVQNCIEDVKKTRKPHASQGYNYEENRTLVLWSPRSEVTRVWLFCLAAIRRRTRRT